MKYLFGLALVCIANIGTAHATVIFQIHRYSDTVATVTGTGSFEVVSGIINSQNIGFDNPFSVDPYPTDNSSIFVSSTMTLTGWYFEPLPISFAATAGSVWHITGTGNASFYAGNDTSISPLVGVLSGELVLQLVNAIWADVGSSGLVVQGAACDGCGSVLQVGSWLMVEGTGSPPVINVPEPSTTLLMLAAGLGMLGTMHSRKLIKR